MNKKEKYQFKNHEGVICSTSEEADELRQLAVEMGYANYEADPENKIRWRAFYWSGKEFVGTIQTQVLYPMSREKFLDKIGYTEFKLPEKWCIHVPATENARISHPEIYNWRCTTDIKAAWMRDGYINDRGLWTDSVMDGYTKITFEQFKKYVMNKDAKEIIGYKCPRDLFNERVKAGEVFTKFSKEVSWYSAPSGHSVPQEIVEEWEPVYKETKLPKLSGIEGKYANGVFIYDKLNIDPYFLMDILDLNKDFNEKVLLKDITLCSNDDDPTWVNLDMDVIRQLLQYREENNK